MAAVRKPVKLPCAPRACALHARFSPDGGDAADALAFTHFWLAAQGESQSRANRKQAGERRALAQKRAAWHKTRPLFVKVLRGQLSPQAAGRRLQKLLPDRELRRWVIERWLQPTQTTPEALKESEEELARRDAEIKEAEHLLEALHCVRQGLSTLAEAAHAGSARAAAHLAAAADEAVGFLHLETARQPGLFRPIARKQLAWPVRAADEPGGRSRR